MAHAWYSQGASSSFKESCIGQVQPNVHGGVVCLVGLDSASPGSKPGALAAVLEAVVVLDTFVSVVVEVTRVGCLKTSEWVSGVRGDAR